MQTPLKERWLELCEQAAQENDSSKLMKLIKEVDRLLSEKRQEADHALGKKKGVASVNPPPSSDRQHSARNYVCRSLSRTISWAKSLQGRTERHNAVRGN